jgi:translation initiation factor 2B subunit (eIF-2B alpha/beta/delta family)
MPHKEVKKTISELTAELKQTPKETAELEQTLEAAEEGIERYTPEAVESFVAKLHHAAEEFEVEHPQVTALINQITTALSSLGI